MKYPDWSTKKEGLPYVVNYILLHCLKAITTFDNIESNNFELNIIETVSKAQNSEQMFTSFSLLGQIIGNDQWNGAFITDMHGVTCYSFS